MSRLRRKQCDMCNRAWIRAGKVVGCGQLPPNRRQFTGNTKNSFRKCDKWSPDLSKGWLHKCEFSGECDSCDSPRGATYAKMSSEWEEVDFYLCSKCARQWHKATAEELEAIEEEARMQREEDWETYRGKEK